MGDVERAAGYYANLLACQGQHHWFLVDRILGEIAQTLHISASTVAKHLTAVFGKTGCENRVASTTFAFQHELA